VRRRAGDGGTNRRIDAVIAMRRIAMPERPNSGRVLRQVGERLARNLAASAAAAGQGEVAWRCPAGGPAMVGHQAILAPLRAVSSRLRPRIRGPVILLTLP
jgi:hypothetical protein